MNLSRWSVRRPVSAAMLVVSILVVGAISAPRLPLAFLPEVDFPQLEITIPYPNSLPAQVEEEITRPAEEALSTLSGVRRMQSYSSANQATISLEFDWGKDIGPLRAEAREKLDRIRDQLPVDVDQIQVNGFRSSDIPVLECRVAAERDLSREYELLDRHIADPLRRVPGVAKVELYGVERPEVLIEFRSAALAAHGLDATRVVQAIDGANRSVSAGTLRNGTETWPLRVSGQFAHLEDIANLPLGHGLHVRDVAAVRYREPELDYGRHLDRARAIGLNVIKESGANSVDVARRAQATLADIHRDPVLRGIKVLTFTDQGADITSAIRSLQHAGVVGALLAVAVLFFFLRNWITTLVVGMAIPFSLLAASALLYFTGRSLNILSMMGLMLAVGMLVDNAVVMLECIYRHRQNGAGRLRAALKGSREVLPAVVCATLTSIIVFLPLVLGGRTEITTWIGEVGRTIIFTLTCSLLLSLTAIPLALGRMLPAGAATPPKAFASLAARYRGVLAWTLAHRPAALGIALAVVASAIVPFLKVDKSTFSASKVETISVSYEFADNLNYRQVERYVSAVEAWALGRKQALHITGTYSYFSHNTAITRLYLAKGYQDDFGAEKVRGLVRGKLPELPGCTLKLEGGDSNTGPTDLTVRIFGDPGPRLTQLGDEAMRRLRDVKGLHDVHVGARKGTEEIEVSVRRDQAAAYGLTPGDVGSAVALFFRGRQLSRYRGPEGEVTMQARLAEEDRTDIEQLERLPLGTPDGRVVPLAAVADLHRALTPTTIERQQRRSVLEVSGNCDSKGVQQTRQAVTAAMNGMALPTGYTWSFGSAFENESATQKELLVNLLLALFLVYVVMAALFESLLHPFAIMCALPFAFVGIAWMCFVTGSPFNLMSQIGLLILIGIVVNNGIVLIHHVHQMRERGVARREALLTASSDRLRPILMTTCTTILGLVPLAAGSSGVGDAMYYPLARTVIGGLAASTALTLLLVPCLYTLFEDGVHLVQRVWHEGVRPAAARGQSPEFSQATEPATIC